MSRINQQTQLTLRDYAAIVWRRKWIILYPIVLTMVVAGALSLLTPVQYRSAAEVLVKLPPTAETVGSSGAVLSPRLVENELRAASGSELQARVRELVGPEPSLSVTADDDSDVFRFTAVSGGSRQAAAAANTYADQYIDQQRSSVISEFTARAVVIQEQLDVAIEQDDSVLEVIELEQELDDLNLSIELARTSGSVLIDEARSGGAPFEPQTRRTVGLAAVIGLLLGLGAAFLLEYVDTSIRDEDEMMAATGLSTLASIPEFDSSTPLIARTDRHAPATEAYRSLRAAVQFLAVDRTLDVIQITSPQPGEGKSTTAANLAVIAARGGQRVVIVDCDLRKPQLHTMFGLANVNGFSSLMLERVRLRDVLLRVEGEKTLWVLPAGPLPPNPSELLSSTRSTKAFAALVNAFDLVIIDSPPVLPVADATVLCGHADGVIIVGTAGVTQRRALERTIDRLEQVDATLVGSVLNRHQAGDAEAYAYAYAAAQGDVHDADLSIDELEPIFGVQVLDGLDGLEGLEGLEGLDGLDDLGSGDDVGEAPVG
jgi:capsular exopolysaccharide synthesis family protein